jgi:hypothetical protein
MTSARFPVVTTQECLHLKQAVDAEERARERFLRTLDTIRSSPSGDNKKPSPSSPAPSELQRQSPTPSKAPSSVAGSKRHSATQQTPEVVTDALPSITEEAPKVKAASNVGSKAGSVVTGSVFSRGSSSMMTNPSSRMPASQASKLKLIGERLSRLEGTVVESIQDDKKIEASLADLKKILTQMKQI